MLCHLLRHIFKAVYFHIAIKEFFLFGAGQFYIKQTSDRPIFCYNHNITGVSKKLSTVIKH